MPVLYRVCLNLETNYNCPFREKYRYINNMAMRDVAPARTFGAGGGQLGKMIDEFDWNATSLGPIAGWPAAMRTTVELVLHPPVDGGGKGRRLRIVLVEDEAEIRDSTEALLAILATKCARPARRKRRWP
jgi:hypothetical protein